MTIFTRIIFYIFWFSPSISIILISSFPLRSWSFSDQDKPIPGEKKDFSSQAEGLLSQPYLGNGYDQDQDWRLGLVLSGHRPGLVHQGNHRLFTILTIKEQRLARSLISGSPEAFSQRHQRQPCKHALSGF